MTAPQLTTAPVAAVGGGVPDAPQTPALTPKEQQLLAFLQAHPGRLFTRQELLLRVWGVRAAQHTRTVDQHIAALRRKCGLDDRLVTVYRQGYLYRAK